MSLSGTSSDCFSSDDSDLLCLEDAGIFTDELPAVYTPDLESFKKKNTPDLVSTSDIEESVALFVQEEGNYLPGFDYPSKFHSVDDDSLDASARQSSIAWILKIQEFYNFQPLTVYLSVNYMDRFLSSRHLPQANGWPLQLLSVACLSLAAKMEESKVPDLLDIQVEDPKHFFEPRTIRKMELIVLTTLDWKLRSITPFNFIDFFANKVDPSGTFVSFLVSQATKIILASIKDISFINYPPSSMAAAAIVCATDEIPNLSFISPGSSVEWCDGLTKERVASCYKLMQEVVLDYTPRTPPKVLPQLRVRAPGVWLSSIDSPSSSSSSSSSSTSTTPSSANKRRKLNTASWIDDDKENKPCIIRGKKKQ